MTARPAPAEPNTALELDPQRATDIACLKRFTEEIKERAELVEGIKVRLRAALVAGTYSFLGRLVLELGAPGRQFDAKLAEQHVPPELLAQISVPRPDADLARRILPAALYDQCCKPKAAAVKAL